MPAFLTNKVQLLSIVKVLLGFVSEHDQYPLFFLGLRLRHCLFDFDIYFLDPQQ